MVTDKYGVPVTEERWLAVENLIRRFIRRYPKHWAIFLQDMHENRTEYGLALKKDDLQKANWRNTAAFPVVYRKATPEDKEYLTGYEEDDLVEVANLSESLKVLLPGLLERDDRKGKPNKLFREFLKRFPMFQVGEKL